MKEGGAGRGGHGVREGVKEDRWQGGADMKEGKQVGKEHGVMEGVSEKGR